MLKNMTLEISPGQIEAGKNRLVSLWLESVDKQSPAPIVNFNHAVELLNLAQKTKQPVAFVAIGCADWHKWDTPEEKTWHVGKIDLNNKRANRFARELKSFQGTLESFGVDSMINLSLSNVEMNDPHRLPEFDGRFDDQETAQINVELSNHNLADILAAAKVKSRLFNHWQLIQQLGFGQIFPTPPTTYQEYMGRLYAFDLTQTALALTKTNQLGPIWLDIQTLSFPELVSELRLQAASQAPVLPIMAPFKNCGNWHSKPEPENHFSDIFELMHSNFHCKPAATQTEWLEKTLKLPDSIILTALTTLGISSFSIDDNWDRRKKAVDLLANIAFNNL